MTVTNKTNTVEEAGNGSKVAFTFDFKTPAAGDLEVYEVDGTTLVATLLTITTHYTVALNTATEGGTVTYVTAPASGKNSFIKRVMDLDQQTDVPTEGNIPEASLNNEYDKSRMIDIQQQDELDRCLKFATTSTLSNFTVPEDTSAANRANKTIAYDTAGTALTLGQSIGTYKGDWATATSYLIRDLVKDTSNNNIYIANEAHTSTGSQPISSNADVAKWDLLVDTATLTDASEATSIKFTFDNSTSMADPGTGDLRFDNATVGSVTNIAVDATSADTGNPDISAYIADLTSGSNVAHEGYIVIKKGSTPATFAVFSITGAVVDNTGWLQIPVTHVASAGAWTAADNMYLTFSRSGNRGRAAGLDMTFEDTTTDTDQGVGKTWLNHATPGSATVFYMDDVDANSTNINSYLDSWDDSSSSVKGHIIMSKHSDPAVFALYNVTGSVTSASTYSKVAVTYVTGAGSFTDADPVAVVFVRGGDKGDTGATGGGMASVVEDVTPQLGGFLDANGNYMQTEKGGDIASASPLVIDTDGDYFDVTGTTNFAAMTVAADRQFTLQFDGALTMTHHATNLDLPSEANITTAAGDVGVFQSTGSNTVQCISYVKADGTAIITSVTKGGDIASASPLVIDTDGSYFDVTGTTNFAAMTVAADRQFTLQFDGALTMTHHATNLDLPGEANITTAAGDVATFQSTGSNTVQCINYTKADGTAVVVAGGGNKTIFVRLNHDDSSAMIGSTLRLGGVLLADGATDLGQAIWTIPDDLTSITNIDFVWVTSAASGNARFGFNATAITGNEDASAGDDDSIAEASYATSGAWFRDEVDVAAMVDGITLTAGHEMFIGAKRFGGSGSDTLSATVFGLGFRINYA